MVSVPGDEAERTRALEGLQSAAGFLRSRAAAALTTRTCPSCTSSSTAGLEHAARINELLQAISRGRSRADRRGAGGQARGPHLARRRCSGCGGRSGPGRWGTPARWIRSRPDSWWCWWGGRPGWRGSSRRRPRRYLATARLGVADRHRRSHRRGRRASGRSRRGLSEAAVAGGAGRSSRARSGSGRPRYSAKHVDGERSYRLARRGEAVEPPEVDGDGAPDRAGGVRRRPRSIFRATVSAGTYLRALGARPGRAARRRRAPGRAAARSDRRAAGRATRCRSTRLDADAVLQPARAVLAPSARRRAGRGGRGRGAHGRAVRGAGDGAGRSRGAALRAGELVAVARAADGSAQAGRWCWRRRDAAVLPPLPREHRDGRLVRRRAPGPPGGAARRSRARAAAAGRASVLVTFEPHPLEVVNPQAAPPLLTTGPGAARDPGADCRSTTCSSSGSTGGWRRLSPEEFVARTSCSARCEMRELVIGHDHGFGRGRSGDVETLRRLGARPRLRGGRGRRRWTSATSTSPARGSAARWPAATSPRAARMLGRPYQVSGVVGRGRAAGPADRRADDQPGRRAAAEAAAARRGLRGPGGVARAAGRAG